MGLFKVGYIFVVSDHSYRVAYYPLKIVLPFSESVYYSEELSIKDIIVPFCSRKGFGEESTRV